MNINIIIITFFFISIFNFFLCYDFYYELYTINSYIMFIYMYYVLN